MTFDPTISLGNLLTIAGVVGVAILGLLRLDFKVKQHEKWIQDHAECNRKQIEILAEVREDLSYIRGRIDKEKR